MFQELPIEAQRGPLKLLYLWQKCRVFVFLSKNWNFSNMVLSEMGTLTTLDTSTDL